MKEAWPWGSLGRCRRSSPPSVCCLWCSSPDLWWNRRHRTPSPAGGDNNVYVCKHSIFDNQQKVLHTAFRLLRSHVKGPATLHFTGFAFTLIARRILLNINRLLDQYHDVTRTSLCYLHKVINKCLKMPSRQVWVHEYFVSDMVFSSVHLVKKS